MLKSAVSSFFKLNGKLCGKLKCYLPQARTDIFHLYQIYVARYMNLKHNQIIIDIGGGKNCVFARHKDFPMNAKIISVDISEEQVKNNCDVDGKLVADAMKCLPFGAEKIDIVVSSCMLEHLRKAEIFIADSERILKKNGYFIHLFPSKFAPFAMINQMLPQKLSKKLLYFLQPESKGVCGFPSFYENCYYSAIKSLLEKYNFEVIQMHFSYYQSPYFCFFVPLFLLSALYEIVVQAIGAKNLCAYVLVVAKKRESC